MRRRDVCQPVRTLCTLLSCMAILVVSSPAAAVCSTVGLDPGRRVAELQTSLGEVCIELLDAAGEAPGHVENFLWYLENDRLVDTFFHRSIDGFVLQGAEFRVAGDDLDQVPAREDWTVENEPCTRDTEVDDLPACSVRGNEAYTVALAKLPDLPDSGTTSWFVNLSDNRANLDNQNGGFTVFGRITDPASRAVIDQIAALDLISDLEDGLDYGVAFWADAEIPPLIGLPVPVQGPFPPHPGDPDLGCSDMGEQATLLQEDLSNLLFELYVPTGESPIYETVSAACGDPLAIPVVTWAPEPGPPGCPDPDRIAIRTLEPTAATGIFPTVPQPFEYVTYTCEQLADARAQRDAFKQARQDYFFDQVAPTFVFIEDATVRPAPEPSPVSVAATSLAAFAWLRARARRRS